MKALKKALAIFGSAVAVIGIAANAMSALAYDPVDLKDRASELENGVINLVADEVYAEPGETVTYRVMITNNTGYAPCGFALVYDKALQPVLADDGIKPALKWGDGSYGLTRSYSVNLDEHLIGYSSMGTVDCTKDGTIYSAEFVVPADAKEDTVYSLTLDVDKLTNAQTDPLTYNVVNGWIRIKTKEETKTTTSTSVTSVTTTVDTDKTTSTESMGTTTTTTVDTTTDTSTSVTTTIETDVSTVSNTSKTDRNDPNSSEPTTASRPGTTATTKKQSTSSTTTATKTGDAGVGVAVAALALSSAVAMLCKRKKSN